MTTLLENAIQAARAGGEIIRAGWGQAHTITLKGVTNPVTEIDHASEEAIVKILHAATPTFGILAEESGRFAGQEDARWIIDPLDGTVNYTHHFPYFAVSIGLERAGILELGVIYDPILDQLFWAERGRGAWLNEERIQVTATATLARSVIAAGFAYDVWETGRHLEEFVRLVRHATTVRLNGCASLDMAYVACGRLEAYWNTGLDPWDTAAGSVLIQEAGGLVTFHGGTTEHPESQSMIAATPAIYAELKDLVLPAGPPAH